MLLDRKKDPFDTFDFLKKMQEKYNVPFIYFFLLADYSNKDRNVSHKRKNVKSIIQQVIKYATTGIHPSYYANTHTTSLEKEKNRLEKITGNMVTKSRQHYIRITLPQSYRILIENGITDDYSMGYATELGFRAGICTPFYFYDLEKEEKTKLKIHPFATMEATLHYYKKIVPENGMKHLKPIIDEIKAVNGTFYSVWHNDFLSDYNDYKGWKNVFEEMCQYSSHN